MPKNNTGNKRASTASTKKSGLKKRFDLTNRKVQFFVVIAIVAVLGGGWFTYRSFAASIETNQITFWPADFVSPSTAAKKNELTLIKDSVPSSKQGMTVAKTKGISIYPDYTPLPSQQLYSWLLANKGKVAKLCASMSATTNLGKYSYGTIIGWGMIDFKGTPVQTTNTPLEWGVYKELCTPNFTITDPRPNVHIAAGNGFSRSNIETGVMTEDVKISYVKLSIVAPAPAPSK